MKTLRCLSWMPSYLAVYVAATGSPTQRLLPVFQDESSAFSCTISQGFRRMAGLRIKENKEVYEGEVTELTPEEMETEGGGYGKVCDFTGDLIRS